MNRSLSLFLVLALATAPAFSQTAVKQTSCQKSTKTAPVKKKQCVQHHHSAIPPKQPLQASGKPKAPLTGLLVYEEERPQELTTPPAVTPTTSNPIPPRVAEPLERTPSLVEQPATKKGSVAAGIHLGALRAHRNTNPGIKERSWVSDVNEDQALQLASSIATYVTRQVPMNSTLLLAPPWKGQAHNALTPALDDSLRKAGFGLVDSKSQAQNAQVLRYQVSRLDDGVWVQVQLNKTEADRFYSLDASHSLVADAPFSVREAQ